MNVADEKIILKTQNLNKRFPGVLALSQVNFELREGEVHALCGENGAGKSTLIKVLSGIHSFGSYEGDVSIYGTEARFSDPADAERAGVAVIYQELALIREMTVAENIFLGSEPRRGGLIDWDVMYRKTHELLNAHGIKLNPAAKVDRLGIGEQQLVEIMKALSKESKILLLDEPTAALTESEVEILFNIIDNLKQQGITCVYISHKLDEVFAVADRITVLRDGMTITTSAADEITKDTVIHHMVGREISDMFPRHEVDPGEVMLDVKSLTVCDQDSDQKILQDISFNVRAGEVVGLGGLMGAGRTELIMHLFGAYGKRESGNVVLNGTDLAHNTPEESIERGMVLVSEDRQRYGVVSEQTIGFNLSLSSLKKFNRMGLINSDHEVAVNEKISRKLNIKANNTEVDINELSGGNQQKVLLGRALMNEPSIILLDEPTRGIDVGAKVEIYELINTLTSQSKAVVLVSSELPELIGMSDRIIILSMGRVGGSFTRNEATQQSILAAAMAFH